MSVPDEVSGELAVTFTPLQDIGLINGQNPFTFDDIILNFAGFDYQVGGLATVIGVRNSRSQFNFISEVADGDFNGRFEITGENCFQSASAVSSGCGQPDFFLRFTDRGQPGPNFAPTFEQYVAVGFNIASTTDVFFAGDVQIERLSASIGGVPIATEQAMTAVPVPASALMLISALAGFAGFGAAKKRQKA